MATLSADKKSVTVVSGDTLSEIARDFSQYSGGASYQQLAALNNIEDPNFIRVGQVIKLVKPTSSSTSYSSASRVTIKEFGGLASNQYGETLCTWTWSQHNNTEHYKVLWEYLDGKNWLVGSDSTTTNRYSTYSHPDSAKRIRFKVRPVSKTKKTGNTETTYFTGKDSYYQYRDIITPPGKPSLNVTVVGLTLTASATTDTQASLVEFDVIKDDSVNFKSRQKANVTTQIAYYSCALTAGGRYKVRCRAYGNGVYSDWTDYSSNFETIPSSPGKITKCEFSTNESIRLEWPAVKNATSYELEYTIVKTNFDTTDQTTKVSNIETTQWEILQLDSGNEYFFRVRAVNEKGSSPWSEISSTVIGKTPAAPTTWSSTSSAIVGEPLNLYWVHNSEDGSSQSYAELELTKEVNGNTATTYYTIQAPTNEDKKDKTSVYEVDTSEFVVGAKIRWRVRTSGVTQVYGDWSIQRIIDVYARPTVDMAVSNSDGETLEELTSFPFHIAAVTGPNTQSPIGYHISIIANQNYETVDNMGNQKIVNSSEELYSKYFDISTDLMISIAAGDINLENNIEYTIICTASMNSGLTAEAKSTFVVSWSDIEFEPNAEIGIDRDTLSAYIKPYCVASEMVYYKVNRSGDTFIKTTNKIDGVYGSRLEKIKTTTGEDVSQGISDTGEQVYYCEDIAFTPITDVLLSVYRREFDGSFTEIAKNLNGNNNTFVTDPHPSLDYARYRIVATSTVNGLTCYNDIPGYPISEKSIVIQWDEKWTNFYDSGSEDELSEQPWSGSLLKLPYNIDVSSKNKADVALIDYIGRKHPVSYYGTQLGETESWSAEIEYDDKETLYALRRLKAWMGNAYVREPSGSGYWANVQVTINQKHNELTIPITLNITRVEGGV